MWNWNTSLRGYAVCLLALLLCAQLHSCNENELGGCFNPDTQWESSGCCVLGGGVLLLLLCARGSVQTRCRDPPGTSCPMLHGAVSILSPDPVRFAYASLSWAAQGLQMDEFPPVALSPSPAQGPTHTRCMTEQKRGREGLSLDAPTSRLWGSRAAECRWGPQLSPQ